MSNDRIVAFLSYRHREFDGAVAEKLQSLLERYSVPKRLRKDGTRRRFHILKDTTDFPLNADLGDGIRAALESAEYLIVICSQRLQESKYCMDEIRHFKQLQKGSSAKIIAVLIDGSPQECIPAELLTSTDKVARAGGPEEMVTRDVEPLCANIIASTQQESLRMLKREYLRVVARLAGCGYPELMIRHTRRMIRRALTIGVSVAVALAAFFAYIGFQAQIIEQKNQSLVEQIHTNQQQQVIRTANYARNLVQTGDRAQAAVILNELYQRADTQASQYEEFRSIADKAAFESVRREPYAQYAQMQLPSPCTFSAFSRDNRMVAVVDEEGTVYVFDASNGLHLHTLATDAKISGLCYTSDFLVGISTQGEVLVWDAQTGEAVSRAQADVSLLADYDSYTVIRRAAYHAPTDSIVFVGYAGSYDRALFVDFMICVSEIGTATDAPPVSVEVYDHIDISKDGEYMLTTVFRHGAPDENILLRWHASRALEDAERVAVGLPEGYGVYRLADNGQLFAFGDGDNLDIFSLPDLSPVSHHDMVPGDFRDARILVADDGSGDFWAWTDSEVFFYPAYVLKYKADDLTKGYEYQLVQGDAGHYPLVQPIPRSSKILVYTASYEDEVSVYGDSASEPVAKLPEKAALGHMSASFDGSTFLTGAQTGTIRLYSMTGTIAVDASKLNVPESVPLAFSKSGLAVIATNLPDLRFSDDDEGGDGQSQTQIAIYDFKTEEKVSQVRVDLDDVNADSLLQPIRACIDEANGRLYMIVPYGTQGACRFGAWDVHTGEAMEVSGEVTAAISGLASNFLSLSVGEDGSRLAILADQEVYIYDAQEDRISDTYPCNVWVAACSLGKDCLYLLGEDIVYVMDIADGSIVGRTRMSAWEGNYLRAFQVSEANNWAVIGGIVDAEVYDTLQWYNLGTGEMLWKKGQYSDEDGAPSFIRACIAQNGEDILAATHFEGFLAIHAPNQGEVRAMLQDVASARTLTAQERSLSGLSIFD